MACIYAVNLVCADKNDKYFTWTECVAARSDAEATGAVLYRLLNAHPGASVGSANAVPMDYDCLAWFLMNMDNAEDAHE